MLRFYLKGSNKRLYRAIAERSRCSHAQRPGWAGARPRENDSPSGTGDAFRSASDQRTFEESPLDSKPF